MRDSEIREADATRGVPPAIRRQLAYLLPAASLLLAAGGPAGAQGVSLYDTSRVLEYRGTECRGIAACETIESAKTRIRAGRGTVLTVNCPTSYPYVVGWDTEQNEHITATLLPRPLAQTPTSAAATTTSAAGTSGPGSRLIVSGVNNGPEVGYITIFLGCAAEPPLPTALMRHRGGDPSNQTSLQGGSR